MTNPRVAVVTSALCLAAGTVITAHHAFSSEYDGERTFTVKGTVSKVEWTNPHVRFYVDVVDDTGTMSTWNLELASPSALARNGWTSRTLKIGDRVTVQGYAARATAARGAARTVVTPEGRSLFAGSAEDALAR